MRGVTSGADERAFARHVPCNRRYAICAAEAGAREDTPPSLE